MFDVYIHNSESLTLCYVTDVGDGNRVVQGTVNAVRDGNVRLHATV